MLTENASLSFWNAVARRNPALAPAYRSGQAVAVQRCDSTGLLVPSTTISELVDDAQKYGIALMEDFLSESQYRVVRDEFDSHSDEPNRFLGSGVAHYERRASPEFLAIFDDAIGDITQRIFGRSLHAPRKMTFIQRDELIGRDVDDPNTILHIDRFIPCVKIFYYPHPILDADQSPFGYVPQSHIVNDEYRACVREFISERPFRVKPFGMRNPTANSECPVLTNGNSILLSFTNGLHRRTPFGVSAPMGSFREVAAFVFYNDYTRRSLLSDVVGGRRRKSLAIKH